MEKKSVRILRVSILFARIPYLIAILKSRVRPKYKRITVPEGIIHKYKKRGLILYT